MYANFANIYSLIVTHRTDLMTIEVQEKFIKFWKISMKKIPEADSALSRLLSPRNIMILAEANNNGVWIKTGEFIKLLLKKEVLSLENLSDQCVALLRQDWSTVRFTLLLDIRIF